MLRTDSYFPFCKFFYMLTSLPSSDLKPNVLKSSHPFPQSCCCWNLRLPSLISSGPLPACPHSSWNSVPVNGHWEHATCTENLLLVRNYHLPPYKAIIPLLAFILISPLYLSSEFNDSFNSVDLKEASSFHHSFAARRNGPEDILIYYTK